MAGIEDGGHAAGPVLSWPLSYCGPSPAPLRTHARARTLADVVAVRDSFCVWPLRGPPGLSPTCCGRFETQHSAITKRSFVSVPTALGRFRFNLVESGHERISSQTLSTSPQIRSTPGQQLSESACFGPVRASSKQSGLLANGRDASTSLRRFRPILARIWPIRSALQHDMCDFRPCAALER